MTNKHIDIDDLRELISQGKSKDPLLFLESVMNGQDPRNRSELYELIMDIHDFCDGKPTPQDWAEVVDHVQAHYKNRPVPLAESMAASKTLSEYLYAKRKQVDINGLQDDTGGAASTELTPDEIQMFMEKWNANYV